MKSYLTALTLLLAVNNIHAWTSSRYIRNVGLHSTVTEDILTTSRPHQLIESIDIISYTNSTDMSTGIIPVVHRVDQAISPTSESVLRKKTYAKSKTLSIVLKRYARPSESVISTSAIPVKVHAASVTPATTPTSVKTDIPGDVSSGLSHLT